MQQYHNQKGQWKKITYTGAHVSDHISRDHWAIFKFQLRREREIGFSADPRWYSVRNNMTNTNAQYPNPPDWGGLQWRMLRHFHTQLIPLAQLQNPVDRSDISNQGSIHDCALSQQTHQKGCRHWLIHPLKSPSPLPLPAPRIISYPHPVYVVEKTEDTQSSTSHHSSVSHPAHFSPNIFPNICGKPVWLGTQSKALYSKKSWMAGE